MSELAMPQTVIHIDWNTRRKTFVATLIQGARYGQPGLIKYIDLGNDMCPPIDRSGALLLLEALRREYGSWVC